MHDVQMNERLGRSKLHASPEGQSSSSMQVSAAVWQKYAWPQLSPQEQCPEHVRASSGEQNAGLVQAQNAPTRLGEQ